MKFLHIFGPDTKNSYGIMTQLFKHCDLEEHHFLIAAYESCKKRFPKLNQFPGLIFIPEKASRLKRVLFFYKQLQEADVIIWHSLFFTTQKYVYFLYAFRKFLKKSVWIEWGADLYVWEYSNRSIKGRIRNHINGVIRRGFRRVGCCFAVDDVEVERQFGKEVRCFYTPLANPMNEATGLIDLVQSCKPEEERDRALRVQMAHNSFQFNNHIRLVELLKKFRKEKIRYVFPLNYGVNGINGQYGGKQYLNAVVKYANRVLGKDKVTVISKAIPFEDYIRFLWTIDVAVFDFDRPCGLGTLRILLLMGKKIFLPAGSPYYDYLVAQGLPIFDTRKIPDMTFEEFSEPAVYTDKSWVYSYMNNDEIIQHWLNMFDAIKEENGICKENAK